MSFPEGDKFLEQNGLSEAAGEATFEKVLGMNREDTLCVLLDNFKFNNMIKSEGDLPFQALKTNTEGLLKSFLGSGQFQDVNLS